MIKRVRIKNFKSIKDSGLIDFSENLFVLAGQNESGKSSILEALNAYEEEEFEREDLNFEQEQLNNLEQEVSCTYQVENISLFCNRLVANLKTSFSIKEGDDFIDKTKLSLIKEYTITKKFDHDSDSLAVLVNDSILNIVRAAIKNKRTVENNESGTEVTTIVPFINFDGKESYLANSLFAISPQIILFNTFSDLLPDKILISDLESKNKNAKGYNAVRNLEKLLNKEFVDISKLSQSHKSSATSSEVQSLSVKFQNAWKQRIYDDGDLKIRFQIENDNVDGQAVLTVFFTIETKDNVLLEPRKRSKGMIWFLSTWLDLKAREDESKLVILYDEPGLYLHVKAHKDILKLFEGLVKKGHQIVYSTHSPSLINTDTLSNIGLVLNTKDLGTVIEGLTSSKINTKYKQDALQPVAEAMGLEPLKDFSILSSKNVILEGLSDFWYFKAMAKILNKEIEYKFVPGIGIKGSHTYHLISFCIGYGLDWLLVMDNGINPCATRDDLKKEIFENDDVKTNEKIKLISVSEIEDMFSIHDLRLIDIKIKASETRKCSAVIGSKRKIIFARNFFQKVSSGEIIKTNLSVTTIKKFEEVFSWIDGQFSS